MWFQKFLFNIKGWFSVHARLNRRVFIWIGFFCLAGLTIGFITIFNPLMDYEKINTTLIDTNLINAVDMKNGFGSIIFTRLFEFILAAAFVFLVCLNNYTALLALAFCSLRACVIVINIYWIIAKFGLMSGLVLVLTYGFFMILLLFVYVAAVIFLMQHCAHIRRNGFRYGTRWDDFWRGLFAFVIVVTIIAFLEWLIYWLILSKFIFLT